MQLRYVVRKQVSRVDLQKDGTTSIGIVLKDGVKTGSRPVIKSIKKGSVAYRSHCVSESDAIVSVCGQDARGMSRKGFKHLLREAESKIELELEYQIQEACLNKSGVYRMERIVSKLRKECESYGFVLRKCGFSCPANRGYPVISYIKEGGPADSDGRLKAGDRLLQIDDQKLEDLSLSEVAAILQAKDEATFTMEYKVALIENSQIRLGERTTLGIECPDADLGIVLTSLGSRMVIDEIRKGSLADRCGIFRVGDDIVAINDTDVAFLSTSKANCLLRNFKKEPRRLILVANTERLTSPRQNSLLTREKIQPLFNEISSQLVPEPDQQVPSNDEVLVSINSPQSLFGGNLEAKAGFLLKCGHYNFQIQSIGLLQKVIENIADLLIFIPSLNKNSMNRLVDNSGDGESNLDQRIQCSELSRLDILSNNIKNIVYSMAMHHAKNGRIMSNRHTDKSACSVDCFNENAECPNQENITQELMKKLVEIYSKKLISKQHLEKFQSKINTIKPNCWKCEKSCLLAALTSEKILLIVSLNGTSKDISLLINKFIEDIFRILPCEDCRVCSKSRTGSDISRTGHLHSLSPLNGKTCISSDLSKVKRTLAGPSGFDRTGDTSFNALNDLQNKHSCSTPSLFSSKTGRESSTSVDGSLANVSIYEPSSLEAVSNLNCKGKAIGSKQTSCYEKRYKRNRKKVGNDTRCIAASYQNQSEEKAVHNNSLGFETPIGCSYVKDNKDKQGNSLLSKINTSIDIQNSSLPYEAEQLPFKDNADYKQSRDSNFFKNINKKMLREKGLSKVQRKNCKSTEIITDSESESLKHSKSKLRLHASEPQFLSTRSQSLADVANEAETDKHVDANDKIVDENRYWSPFHRSDNQDHPNILDIPNWSAKSSHSLKHIDQVSDKTTQDTVDVTLKNEGKGFGLRIEFLGSPSDDLNQIPRITAVSSQGPAYKIGILMKGDRVLKINGQTTAGLAAAEFEHLKEEALNGEEILLTVEFDILIRNLQFGTFDVCVTKTSKTGLVYNDFKKGSSLVVKGIVKGSPSHRCGSLMPGDEVLCANNIRQEFYDVSKNSYQRSEYVIIRVRRQSFEEKLGDETNLDHAELLNFKSYDLSRTSIHSNHDSNKMFLEQDLTLYRDPVANDFGFLIGQDQDSKIIYVTGIRPDGPADCSKVIQKDDIILQVNGINLEMNKNGPVASLFHPTGDRLQLKTRRIIKL